MNEISWDELVDRFLAAVDGLTEREVEERTGVSASRYREWARARAEGKSIGSPRGNPRSALQRLVAHGNPWLPDFGKSEAPPQDDGREGEPPPYNEEREEEELARIGQLPNALLRTLERESIAAVIRAQGMRDACRAARIEAEKAPNRSSIPQPISSDQVEAFYRVADRLAELMGGPAAGGKPSETRAQTG